MSYSKIRISEIAYLQLGYSLSVCSRRNRVNFTVKKQWPGNSLPTFKGKGRKCEELEELVAKLLPDCSYCPPSLSGVVFGKNAIKQHIMDSLNERRRRVHSGHDYETVCLSDTTDTRLLISVFPKLCSLLLKRSRQSLRRNQLEMV